MSGAIFGASPGSPVTQTTSHHATEDPLMITRVIQRERPRSLALLLFVGAMLVAAGLFAAVAVALSDTGTYSVEVADKKHSAEADVGNAIVQYLGSSDPNALIDY